MSQARAVELEPKPHVTALAPATAPVPTRPKPRRVRKKSRAWIGWVVFLLMVAGGGIAYWRYAVTHHAPEVTFKTVPAETRTITGTVKATGTLQAVVTVQVGSQVSGRIGHLYADFNSKVKKGQKIATIDPQSFQAQVQQANANYVQAAAQLVQAQATLTNAERIYKRQKALNEQTLATQADLEAAETALAIAKSGIDVARGGLEQARAALNLAKVNLSYTDIFSPIDGVVISRSVDVGQTVAASLQAPVLFTIAEDLKKMQVNTNVTEGDVGRLQDGQKTYFTVDAFPGQRFRGKISQIRNAAVTVQNVVTYDAVIDVSNDDLRLRPGMTANVTVTFDRRENVLAVPNSALRFRPPPSVLGSAAPSGSGHRRGRGHGRDESSAHGDRADKGDNGSAHGDNAHDKGEGDSNGEKGETPAHGDKGDGNSHGDKGDKKHDSAGNRTKEIWVLRDDKPVAIQVHTGLTDGSWVEILDGDITESDQVIIDSTSAGGNETRKPVNTSLRKMF